MKFIMKGGEKRMKKLIMLAMVLCFMFMLTQVREAKAIEPVATPFMIASSLSIPAATPWVVAAAAVFGPPLVLSPYIYMYVNHPECRKELSIGDMSKCVQSGSKKK